MVCEYQFFGETHFLVSPFYYFVCKYERTSTKLRNTVSDSPLSFADPGKIPHVLLIGPKKFKKQSPNKVNNASREHVACC